MEVKIKQYVIGLDIGSTQVAAAICEVGPDELHFLGLGKATVQGLSKGQVVDREALGASIEKAIERAKKEVGVSPTKIILNVLPSTVKFSTNTGLVNASGGRISQEDKRLCLQRARHIVKRAEQKILHMVPLQYRVDGNRVIQPVGVFGRTLEVDAFIVLGDLDGIEAVIDGIFQKGYSVESVVYSPLASAHVFLSEEERKKGTLLVDFGGQFTLFSLYKEGALHKSYVLPMGGETLTADIATCLGVSVPEAERIKIMYGHVAFSKISPEEDIQITTLSEGRKTIKRHYLCQILEARFNEMLMFAKKEFSAELADFSSIVIGGKGNQLRGVKSYTEGFFSVPVRLGVSDTIQAIIPEADGVNAAGLVLYAIQSGILRIEETKSVSLFSKVKQALFKW